MGLTSTFFHFIFYYNNSSIPSQPRRTECINYCSGFLINTLPGVEDAEMIKESKIALSLPNMLWIQHTAIQAGWPSAMQIDKNGRSCENGRPREKNPWIHKKPYIQKPLEFHTAIKFDFERYEWLQDDLIRTKLVADDHWWTDDEYQIKYPILRDSLGILTFNWLDDKG